MRLYLSIIIQAERDACPQNPHHRGPKTEEAFHSADSAASAAEPVSCENPICHCWPDKFLECLASTATHHYAAGLTQASISWSPLFSLLDNSCSSNFLTMSATWSYASAREKLNGNSITQCLNASSFLLLLHLPTFPLSPLSHLLHFPIFPLSHLLHLPIFPPSPIAESEAGASQGQGAAAA